MWVGTGDVHLTYIPRKPTPLGIMLKSLVDASSGVMLSCELVESKEAMADAKFNKEWGATTGTTLRLAAPFAGKGRVMIADSWFGSLRCAYALWKLMGTFSIMVVKTNSAGYPKKFLKEKANTRGDMHCLQHEVDGV